MRLNEKYIKISDEQVQLKFYMLDQNQMDTHLKPDRSEFSLLPTRLIIFVCFLGAVLSVSANTSPSNTNFPLAPAGYTDLTSYQIHQVQTQCQDLNCLQRLAQSQNALGDYREFARTMLHQSLHASLRQQQPNLDLNSLQAFAQLPPRRLSHTQQQFALPIINAQQINTATDYFHPGLDARPRLTLEFNGKAQAMIFDTGAGLDLPAEFAQQFADQFIKTKASSSTAAALTYATPFVRIDTIKFGPVEIENAVSSVRVQAAGMANTASATSGLFGTSEFLHFANVLVDIQAGFLEFNSTKKLPNCLPLRLRFNSRHTLEGLVVPLQINGQRISARLDTGANSGLLLHNTKQRDPDKIEGEVMMVMKDLAGNRFGLKQEAVTLQLGRQQAKQNALIAGFDHPAFDATLGIKFFQRRAFMLDFLRSELCTELF